MNIFVTSISPYKSALYLDDKRVVKMCLETTQILCTALNELVGEQITPLKSTHVNHPCVQWAMSSLSNWYWLYRHGLYLFKEYENRYKRHHAYTKYANQLYKQALEVSNTDVEREQGIRPPQDFVNCAANKELGIDFKSIPSTTYAYFLYLQERWKTDKRTPTWYGWSYPKLNKEYHNVFQLIEEDYGNE